MSDNGTDVEGTSVSDGCGCEATDGGNCILSEASVGSRELDRLFSILSSRRRRFALYHLVWSEEQVVERAELAEAVLEYEGYDGETGEPPPTASVVTDLHHGVLPRLQDEGYIEYDRRQGTVRYDGPPEHENCLAALRTLERTGAEWRESG